MPDAGLPGIADDEDWPVDGMPAEDFSICIGTMGRGMGAERNTAPAGWDSGAEGTAPGLPANNPTVSDPPTMKA